MPPRLKKERILVSACLVNIGCRYDARIRKNRLLSDLFDKVIFFPLCPEILAGFGMPRACMEIKGGRGEDVLNGKAEVVTQEGVLVTDKMVKIAREVLKFCSEAGIKKALFKEKSPSCGRYFVYDGSFRGRLIKGEGVVTALLQREGIKVFSDEEYEQGIFENN